MFEGFSNETIDFMWNLRLNNRKDWFEAHREEFRRHFQQPMKELGAEVYGRVLERCGDRGFRHKVSRIHKDARRLRGDGPYRDHLWFSIERPSEEWTFTPTFWFELGPESWSSGLGYYQARPETMAKLRARIDKHPQQFETLIAPLAEQEEFLLDGPEYVRKRTPPAPGVAAWYNRRSFSLIHEQPNGPELFERGLADRLVEGFAFLMPLYDYFVTLDADPAPE